MSAEPGILILKLGDTVAGVRRRRGDFEDWFRDAFAHAGVPTRIADPRRGEALPPPCDLAGAVVTGASAMVTDNLPWSESTAAWLAEAAAAELPVLGVCYGHQLLARALGGTVGDNPKGWEAGTVEVRARPEARADPLLGRLPGVFPAHASHRQSVLSLPAGATALAENGHDPHQAFVWGRCAWGLQFHPEFDEDILRGYLAERASGLAAAGQDPRARAASIRPTPEAAGILTRFALYCRSG